jgi:hypothetical protein
VPRGPADRPIRAADDDAALQAAMRRALEQAAAPMEARTPAPDPPVFGTRVAQTAPVRAAIGATRHKGAPAFSPVRPGKRARKESPGRAVVPDPRGRGRKVDLRS